MTMQYGKIYGTFLQVSADGSDSDDELDVSGDSSLTVTLFPSVRQIRISDELIHINPINCRVSATGNLLGPNGKPDIRLLATDVGTPLNWHWTAQFSRLDWPDLEFTLPADSRLNLATLAPLPVPPTTLKITDEQTALAAKNALARAEEALVRAEDALTRGTIPHSSWVKDLLKSLDGPQDQDVYAFEPDETGRILLWVRGGKVFTRSQYATWPGVGDRWRLHKGVEKIEDAASGAILTVPENEQSWLALASGDDENLQLDAPDWPAYGFVWVTPRDQRTNLQTDVSLTLGPAETVSVEENWEGEYDVTITHSPVLPSEYGSGRIDLSYPLVMSARGQNSLPSNFVISSLRSDVNDGKLRTNLTVNVPSQDVPLLSELQTWTLDIDRCTVEY